jgi:hypothetical protein
MEIFS